MNKLEKEILDFMQDKSSTSMRNLSISLKKSMGDIAEALVYLSEIGKVKRRQLHCGMIVWELKE